MHCVVLFHNRYLNCIRSSWTAIRRSASDLTAFFSVTQQTSLWYSNSPNPTPGCSSKRHLWWRPLLMVEIPKSYPPHFNRSYPTSWHCHNKHQNSWVQLGTASPDWLEVICEFRGVEGDYLMWTIRHGVNETTVGLACIRSIQFQNILIALIRTQRDGFTELLKTRSGVLNAQFKLAKQNDIIIVKSDVQLAETRWALKESDPSYHSPYYFTSGQWSNKIN
jgi:hypothetical protein